MKNKAKEWMVWVGGSGGERMTGRIVSRKSVAFFLLIAIFFE